MSTLRQIQRSSALLQQRNQIWASARRFFSDQKHFFTVDNPYTGEVACTVERISAADAAKKASLSKQTFQSWRNSSRKDRVDLMQNVFRIFKERKAAIAKDITAQMGKPLKQAEHEVNTLVSRGEALCQLSGMAHMPLPLASEDNISRVVHMEPIGPVLLLSPWNYPLITAANTVFHAVLSGCTVMIKHSDRTPLIADVFQTIFEEAGAPKGLVQALQADHDLVHQIIQNPNVALVQFTGSVGGGHKVYQSVAQRFIDVGLELGGKDAAYVMDDCNFEKTVENVIDGAFYNAGQSCCAVERVYVHRSLYKRFLDASVQLANDYVLGDPLDPATSMGPMAQPQAITFLQKQVEEAKAKGAKVLCGGKPTTDKKGKGRFFQPTVVADCDHTMSIIVDESFGPVVAIAPVDNDEQALKLMNDSPYGLTASLWTENSERAEGLGRQLDVGTVFMNRCDFLDPFLPWSGRRDSGKGVSLSALGFTQFLRPKSYNFRKW